MECLPHGSGIQLFKVFNIDVYDKSISYYIGDIIIKQKV